MKHFCVSDLYVIYLHTKCYFDLFDEEREIDVVVDGFFFFFIFFFQIKGTEFG